MKRTLLIGDSWSLPILIKLFPKDAIAGLMFAKNRPDGHEFLVSLANELSIPYFVQPLKREHFELSLFYQAVEAASFEMAFCFSYSQLFLKEFLDLFFGQVFNLHSSLLPKNRGAHPVQWVIKKGEEKTGVTLHRVVQALDAGPIILQKSLIVEKNENWQSLQDKLNELCFELISQGVPRLLTGDYEEIMQDDSEATTNPRIPLDQYLPKDFK